MAVKKSLGHIARRVTRRVKVKTVRSAQKLKTKAKSGYYSTKEGAKKAYTKTKAGAKKVGAHVKKHKTTYGVAGVGLGLVGAHAVGKRRGKRMRGRPRKRR